MKWTKMNCTNILAWIEVHDERSGMVAYFNKTTAEIQPNRPKGWVNMLSMVYSTKEIKDVFK